jgi:hypothetical protein
MAKRNDSSVSTQQKLMAIQVLTYRPAVCIDQLFVLTNGPMEPRSNWKLGQKKCSVGCPKVVLVGDGGWACSFFSRVSNTERMKWVEHWGLF